MPFKSRWSIDIPECSLPTFLLKSPSTDLTDKPCFIDADRPDTHFFTRNSFRTWAQRLALGLTKSSHFNHGDRILLFSNNQIFTPVVLMGTVMAGGIFSGANPSFTARELGYQWKNSGAVYLLCLDAAIDIGLAAAKEAGMDADRVLVFNSAIFDGANTQGTQSIKGCRYWGELLADAEEAKSYKWEDLKGPGENEKTIVLNYSSGTTGFPKGVEVTHKNYVANTLQQNFLPTLRSDYEEREKTRKWLCCLPLYHAMGQTIYIAGSLLRAIPVYIMPKFDFVQMLENVQKFKISEIAFVPPIAVAMAKNPIVKKYDLSSVDAIGCGAAPLGVDASLQLEKVWDGKINLKQGYGMTEVTCSVLGWDPNKWSTSFGVGEPNPNVECKLMQSEPKDPDTFTEITQRGPEHRGELWVRGPNIMKGYWQNPQATRDTFSSDNERWLRTGDVAYVDNEGTFFIVDRIKELIKVKGNQVAPAELEALLLEHPSVSDAAVIGIPTPDGDELPRAYIIKQQDSQSQAITDKEIQSYIKQKVVRYKQLAGGVEFVKEIPKNPSGKILRRYIRDEYQKKHGKPGARL